jgi:hypothetical protein
MNLCKYKDIFGKPNEGLHKYRIFNIAIIDVIMTYIFGYIITKFINKKKEYNIEIWKVFIILLILSIIIHKIFCVETTIIKMLKIL